MLNIGPIGCIVYADNVMLLSGSVVKLQKMLDICYGIVTRGPRTLKISWESPNIGWKNGGLRWGELGRVGCASGRETSPGTLTPELIE